MRHLRRRRAALAVLVLAPVWSASTARAYDSYGADIPTPNTHNAHMSRPPWPIGEGFFGSPSAASPLGGAPIDMLTYDANYSIDDDPHRASFGWQRMWAGSDNNHPAMNDPTYSLMFRGAMNRGYWHDDKAVTGIYTCPASALGGGGLDLTACTVPEVLEEMTRTSGPNKGTPPGWYRVRRRWDLVAQSKAAEIGHGPEHMLMLLEAARYAGLDTNPLFQPGATFWVRYPVADAYVASPIADGTRFVVGQSWKPVAPADTGALATRPVSLPELTQMPDVSLSVGDWAAGNEDCPKSILDEMRRNGAVLFGDPDGDVNACHAFRRIVGAVNASHFHPAAKVNFAHYHGMALRRMAQCNALKPISDAFAPPPVTSPYDYINWLEPIDYDSEAHECEREAFVYEMFAQHFLQDAWSTGHMWYRWGTPDYASFPDKLGVWPYSNPKGADDTDAPDANRAARRYAIAALVAGFAGMEHGSKGVAADIFSKVNLQNLAWLDDPLCAPRYWNPWLDGGDPSYTRWRSADGIFRGVGDLYWDYTRGDPDTVVTSLKRQPEYDEQRVRLLACSAKSLRDVYGAGPAMHGRMRDAVAIPYYDGNGGSAVDPSTVDVTSDYCFGQLATNASMFGAFGPFYARRKWDVRKLQFDDQSFRYVTTEQIIKAVNQLTANDIAGAPAFADLIDKKEFIENLMKRLEADLVNQALQFSLHTFKRPFGTEAAQLLVAAFDNRNPGGIPEGITMLNVPPGKPPSTPPAPYADSDDPALANDPAQTYVRGMFWQSHLAETCKDTSVLGTLRDRCVLAAAGGGDPEACTECVDLAQLHVPSCGYTAQTGPSKCQRIGTEGSVSELPPEWFDPAFCHCDGSGVSGGSTDPHADPSCGRQPRELAAQYCTGTTRIPGQRALGGKRLWTSPTSQSPVQIRLRIGTWGDGNDAVDPASLVPTAGNRPRPIVTAYEETITTDIVKAMDGSGALVDNHRATSDRDDVLQAMFANLPIWADKSQGFHGLQGEWEPLAVPTCGVTQRMTLWSGTCDHVLAEYWGVLHLTSSPGSGGGLPGGLDDGGQPEAGQIDERTGERYLPHVGPSIILNTHVEADGAVEEPGPPQPRCSIAEARTFTPQCPGGATCGSGGACVFKRWDGKALATPPLPPYVRLQ